jgi:hypothetical protein
METELASETRFLKKSDDGQSSKQEDCRVNFSRDLFPVLDFMILEVWTDRLSQNISKELPFTAV